MVQEDGRANLTFEENKVAAAMIERQNKETLQFAVHKIASASPLSELQKDQREFQKAMETL